MQVVWINKNPWCKPGPIVYMGLLNAFAFAWNDIATTLFVAAGNPSDTTADLRDFYGLEPHPQLTIERVAEADGRGRAVYRAALAAISAHCQRGEQVVVLTRELGCLPALLALRRRFPALRVLHETHDYYLSLRHLPQRSFSALRRHWSERLLLPHVDGLICLTEPQRALYQQQLPRLPMLALPLGTLPQVADAQQLERRRQARCVAYIGHLHDYKGLASLFALAHQLKQHRIHLHAFGGGKAQIEALRQRARDEGIGGDLQFTPFLPPRQLHAQLAHTVSIGLVPLEDTFYNRYLTCPVKALDFLAHGLPTIGTDLPAVRAVLGEAGIYADVGDTEATAAAIADLLGDPLGDPLGDLLDNQLENPGRYAQACGASQMRANALTWRRRGAALIRFIHDIEPRCSQ